MASNKRSGEPNAAPPPDVWYNLALGSSFKDHNPSSKFCTLRYEFKPASIDKNQTGTLIKNKENRVTVEFQNNQHGKPKVTFEGSSEDYKENDAVLFFDGESFRLERLHRAVKRLRHVRQPGESAAVAAPAAFESSPPPLAKQPAKFQPSAKSVPLPVSVEVERIDIGDFKSTDQKSKYEKPIDNYHQQPISQNTPNASPDFGHEELEEQLGILNDDDDDMEGIPVINRENTSEKEEYNTGIDINIPHHQSDIDNEIADIDDDSDDDEVNKGNAAEALRAQVNAEVAKDGQSSSSSESSESESSETSGSGTGSSTSDSDSSDDGDSGNSA
jgi:ELL-associated factor